MEKYYVAPEMEITEFVTENIITTSPPVLPQIPAEDYFNENNNN